MPLRWAICRARMMRQPHPRRHGDAPVIFPGHRANSPGGSASTTAALYESGVRDFSIPGRPAVPLMSDFFVPDADLRRRRQREALPSVGEAQKGQSGGEEAWCGLIAGGVLRAW
jgi:hypothetical protein